MNNKTWKLSTGPPPRLCRKVEFLTKQVDPAEVLAIRIRQYAGQGLKTLVPKVIGQTAEAKQKRSVALKGN